MVRYLNCGRCDRNAYYLVCFHTRKLCAVNGAATLWIFRIYICFLFGFRGQPLSADRHLVWAAKSGRMYVRTQATEDLAVEQESVSASGYNTYNGWKTRTPSPFFAFLHSTRHDDHIQFFTSPDTITIDHSYNSGGAKIVFIYFHVWSQTTNCTLLSSIIWRVNYPIAPKFIGFDYLSGLFANIRMYERLSI